MSDLVGNPGQGSRDAMQINSVNQTEFMSFAGFSWKHSSVPLILESDSANKKISAHLQKERMI